MNTREFIKFWNIPKARQRNDFSISSSPSNLLGFGSEKGALGVFLTSKTRRQSHISFDNAVAIIIITLW